MLLKEESDDGEGAHSSLYLCPSPARGPTACFKVALTLQEGLGLGILNPVLVSCHGPKG